MSKFDTLLTRLLGAIIILFGLTELLGAFGAGGVFGVLGTLAFGLFVLVVGVGFWRRQHWAFVATSIALLAGFFYFGFHLVLAVDTGVEVKKHAAIFIANVALIGYVGRWGLERHFAHS